MPESLESITRNLDRNGEVEHFLFPAHGGIPNHPSFPLILYRSVFKQMPEMPECGFERLYGLNDWSGSWRNGVFSFHHYHAEAHEVLGIYSGKATVRFGGEGGKDITVSRGDVVIIPAGVGHKAMTADSEFGVVGAYPCGQSPDLRRDDGGIDGTILSAIRSVTYPDRDPIFGEDGPLQQLWLCGGE